MSISRNRSKAQGIPRSILWGAGFFVFILGLLPGGVALATDLSSTNFIVRDPVSTGGGGLSTSVNFQLWSSFSQNAQGKSTSASNELRSGFLYFVDATPPPPPPPPPPTGGGSTGSGSQTTPPPSGGGPPPPPPAIPPFVPPLISIILGDQIPDVCIRPGLSRSDFNCDGDVDLRDLSILLTKPKLVSGRVLSYLFSDWTRRLPIPAGENIAVAPSVSSERNQGGGLAQVGETLTPRGEGAEEVVPPRQGFFRSVIQFFRMVGGAILRLFGISR